MTKNVLKSVYCACHIDNSAGGDNYVSLTGAVFTSKQFSFDIWLYIQGDATTILSQEGGFTFGVENGVMCISHPSIGKKTVRSDVLPIRRNEWVNVFAVYDGNKLSLAVNGIPVGQVSCADVSFWNTSDIDVGRDFHGYCRSVRLYNTAVAEEQYHTYISRTTYDAQTMPNLAAFADMMQKTIPDLSGQGVRATRHGAVAVTDIAHVYRPSAGRYASLAQGGAVNPGGLESGSFAIYIKTYLRPSSRAKHALASNGAFDEDDCVIVYTETTDDMTSSVHLCLGERDILITGGLTPYQWVDVIVCYQGGKVTAFVNGAPFECTATMTSRTGKGEFKLGNAFGGGDCTCEHYIAMCAVFDRPLIQSDADDFLENHPFIFEKGLIALFGFVTGTPHEWVTCREMQCDSADLIVAQRTFEELPQSPYKYRVNQAPPEPSKMRLWKAATIWGEVKSYYKETYGLESTLDTVQEEAAIRAIASDNDCLSAFAAIFTAASITSTLVALAIAAVKGAKMAKLAGMGAFSGVGAVGGAAGAAGVAGAAAAGAGAVQVGSMFAALAASVAIVAAIAAVAAEIAKENRKNKPDQEDDDDLPMVKLLEISLQHTPDNPAISAVRCRDHVGSRLPPEWTSAKRTGAEAVYIADRMQAVTIKVKFKICDNSKKPAASYNVSLWSFAVDTPALFDDFSMTESGLSREVEYVREFTAKVVNKPSAGLWKHVLELWWNYTVNGHTDTLPNTELTLYTLPTTPVEPICMGAEAKDENIQLVYLRLAAKPYSPSTELSCANFVEVTQDQLVTVMNNLYNNAKLHYDPNPHPFVDLCNVVQANPPGAVVGYANRLNVQAMLTALNGATEQAPVNANCNIYASILSFVFACYGVHSEIAIIQTGDGTLLHTVPCVGAPGGGAAQSYEFTYHAIVEVSPQLSVPGLTQRVCFDASNRTDGIFHLGNMVFRTNYFSPTITQGEVNLSYRGHMFLVNTKAIKVHNRALMLIYP